MSRHWKEPYSLIKARQLSIRDMEGDVIIGDYLTESQTVLVKDEQGQYQSVTKENVVSGLTDCYARQMNKLPINKWIYYVYVCRFTFAFFSLEDVPYYIRYYSTKILPSRILNTPHSDNDARQDTFTRLPLYLRDNSKRLRVVKALQAALAEFQKEEDRQD